MTNLVRVLCAVMYCGGEKGSKGCHQPRPHLSIVHDKTYMHSDIATDDSSANVLMRKLAFVLNNAFHGLNQYKLSE